MARLGRARPQRQILTRKAVQPSLTASTSVGFTANAKHNRMFVATSIDFSESATYKVGTDISPLILPIRQYIIATVAQGAIQGATSVDFTASAHHNRMFAATSVAFSETVDLNGKGELKGSETLAFTANLAANILRATPSIDFSETVDLNATGKLESAQPETISFTANAKHNRMFAATSVAFTANAKHNRMFAAASVDFSELATLTPKLHGVTSIAFSESGTLLQPLIGSTSIAFTANAKHNRMFAAASVDFSESVDLNGAGKLASAASVAFTANAKHNRMFATTSIDFTEVGTLVVPSEITAISPLILPIKGYDFSSAKQAYVGLTSVDFSESATLTGTGALGGSKIRASVVIDVIGPVFLWLQGKGELKGAATLAFSQSGTLAGQIQAATSIGFTTDAKISGGLSPIVGNVSIDFTTSIDLNAKGSLAAVTSIAFSESVIPKGQLLASTAIEFQNPGTLFRVVTALVSIAFSHRAVLQGPFTPIPGSPDSIAISGATGEIQFKGEAQDTKIHGDRTSIT